jgi:predicted porin
MPAGQISFISTASVVENGGAGGPANTGPAAGSATGLVATCNGTTAASQCDFEQGAVGVSWDHMFGPYHAMVQYATVDKITGSGCSSTVVPASGTAGQQCDNTGAKQITVGMRYIFSKRTHAYVSYNKIDNEANTNMDYIPGGISARLTATNLFVGADPTIIAVGMLHNF